jgi:putative oxidoreductase
MSVKHILGADTGGISASVGLFVLRTCVGVSLFVKHGLEKVTGYSVMVQHFPDPLHLGSHTSLAFAPLSDGICSVLVVLGLGTRPAAAVIVINLLTAFFFVHHAAFFSNGHVELVGVYIAVFGAILLLRPGRFSADKVLSEKTASQSA